MLPDGPGSIQKPQRKTFRIHLYHTFDPTRFEEFFYFSEVFEVRYPYRCTSINNRFHMDNSMALWGQIQKWEDIELFFEHFSDSTINPYPWVPPPCSRSGKNKGGGGPQDPQYPKKFSACGGLETPFLNLLEVPKVLQVKFLRLQKRRRRKFWKLTSSKCRKPFKNTFLRWFST